MSRPRFEWKYVTTGRMIDNKTSKIFDTKDECLCLLNDLEAKLAEARENIYKFAEIALMQGEDEFGHSWEDFKFYVLDEQLKEKGDE